MLISPFADVRIVLGTWRTLLKNAVPIGLNNLITPVQRGILTRLLAGLGAPVVAGYGVAIRVESFTLTCIFALQSVIGIFIGSLATKRVHPERIKALFASTVLGGTLAVLFKQLNLRFIDSIVIFGIALGSTCAILYSAFLKRRGEK